MKGLFQLPPRATKAGDLSLVNKLAKPAPASKGVVVRQGKGIMERMPAIKAMANRYLGQYADIYKVIQDEETKLTTEDVEQLLKNPTLTPFQKITLQDALMDGTHTREHVLQANRKSQPKDILKLFREGNYG